MSQSALLDTHCHIGLYPDPIGTLEAADRAGVSIVAVTETPDEYRRLRTRLGPRNNVEVALGLHPLRAASFGPNVLARFFRLLPQTRWIGEVGLDYSAVGAGTARAQQRIFDVVLTEAQPQMHPLTVHSRGAERDVIKRLADAAVPAVLHWYSGPVSLVDDALTAGLFFSVNEAMARSRKFPSLIRALPPERVLLETDGPFAKSGGSPLEPTNLDCLVMRLAVAWQLDATAAKQTILDNQARLMRSA